MSGTTDYELLKSTIVESLGKKFLISLYGPDNYRAAVITHYAYSRNRKLRNPAIQYLNEILKENDEWELPDVFAEEVIQTYFSLDDVPFPKPKRPSFTFIDLFAGIGGFRIAMQSLNGECVFSSEWDEEAQKTYYANFGEIPFGDITQQRTKDWIPKQFDVLCAGFPCQAFSIAGKRGGFNDTRGTLFFDVATIIEKHKPKAIFLENVKGLVNHDGGKTLSTILNVLREDLKYFVPKPEIINAKYFGVPQNRERIYIAGFRQDQKVNDFKYPESKEVTKKITDVFEDKPVSSKYYLSNQYLNTLIKHRERHASKGNGFGYEIIPHHGVANAIVVGGMGRERNLVEDNRQKDLTPVTHIKGEVNTQGIRRLTPLEWKRLQGFPEEFKINAVSDASLYRQFGNSVAVPAIKATAEKILEKINLI